MKSNQRLHELISRYQTEQISEAEFAELEANLRDSESARTLFYRMCRVDSQLRREAENSDEIHKTETETVEPGKIISPIFRPIAWISAAAAVVLLTALTWTHASRPKIIATLVSTEDAYWESSLPTEPGSRLSRGYLKLKAGVATFRFESGAELVLEAPAKLMLKGSMRAKLYSGAAMLEVPESAIGFVLETPNGYAVDYGTKFAVEVKRSNNHSNFEVIEGEIAVHHVGSGDEVRLIGKGESATVLENSLVSFDALVHEEMGIEDQPEVIRIGTNGRTTSVIPTNKRSKHLRSDVLSVKHATNEKWDHRSFFAFDISAVDLSSSKTARLRLNLIPSPTGFVSRLPKISRFAVYGLTNHAKENWKIESLWEEAPTPEDGVLIGKFEVPRSAQHGSFGIENGELLDFLKANRDRPEVTFILVRETIQVAGKGVEMTHRFASDSHPEAVGPLLEFSVSD